MRKLADETAENTERWAVHESECSARYNGLRRDLKDTMRFVKWLVASMIVPCAIVIGKGTLIPSVETILALLK